MPGSLGTPVFLPQRAGWGGGGTWDLPTDCEAAAWGQLCCHTMQPRLRILVILKTIYCKEPWTQCAVRRDPIPPVPGREEHACDPHVTALATPSSQAAAVRRPDPGRGGGRWERRGVLQGHPRKGCRYKAGLGPWPGTSEVHRGRQARSIDPDPRGHPPGAGSPRGWRSRRRGGLGQQLLGAPPRGSLHVAGLTRAPLSPAAQTRPGQLSMVGALSPWQGGGQGSPRTRASGAPAGLPGPGQQLGHTGLPASRGRRAAAGPVPANSARRAGRVAGGSPAAGQAAEQVRQPHGRQQEVGGVDGAPAWCLRAAQGLERPCLQRWPPGHRGGGGVTGEQGP